MIAAWTEVNVILQRHSHTMSTDTPSRHSASPGREGPEATLSPSPWRGGSRSRSREREIKRDAVIRAAARAFNHHGYHNTSIADIARDLAVTKPTIYYYVRNKEDLLYQCFREGLAGIEGAFAAVRHSKQPARERLGIVLRRYAEAIASDFGWCMIRADDHDLSAELSRDIRSLKSGIDQAIRRLIREGIEDGSVAGCDPKMAAFALAGALNSIGHWYRADQSLSPEQIADAFVGLFEQGLLPRAGARKSRNREV
jgi:AcrR family transcriptional regulator